MAFIDVKNLVIVGTASHAGKPVSVFTVCFIIKFSRSSGIIYFEALMYLVWYGLLN